MSKKRSWFTRVIDFFFAVKDDQKEQLKNKKKKKKKRPPSTPSLYNERTEINPRTQEFSAEASDEFSAEKILLRHAQLVQHVEHLASIKIQTSFRGYLARKALRALRGLVKLQAIIRGTTVRRQAVATLKSLQSIVNIQSQVCAIRSQMANDFKQNEDLRDVKLNIEQKRRDHTLLMSNEDDAIILSKTEAMMRRNRIKAHSFNHRHSADTEDGRMIGRLRRWLEERGEYEVPIKEDIKRVDTIRLRNGHVATLAPRIHRPKSRSGEKLEAKPAYMAATESARARSKLIRPMQLESYSDGDSPYKSKLLSPMSTSMNSYRNFRQRSCIGYRGIGGSMRFNRNSGDNGRWLLNWN